MEVKIIEELTLFSLKLIPQQPVNIPDFFSSKLDSFTNDFTVESDEHGMMLRSKDKKQQFAIQYNNRFIEILSFDFEVDNKLNKYVNLISDIGNFEDIILTIETAFGFESNEDRNLFFKKHQPVVSFLSNDDSSLFYVKEMIEKDGYRFILSLLQDSARNNKNNITPVIGCSLESTMIENGVFKFGAATKTISELMKDILTKLSTI